MVTTRQILSLDQGKLIPKGETEDHYFGRFTSLEPIENRWRFRAILRLPARIWRNRLVDDHAAWRSFLCGYRHPFSASKRARVARLGAPGRIGAPGVIRR